MLLGHRQKPTRRLDGVSSDRQILRLLSVTYCMFLEKHCFPVKSLLCTGAAFLASSASIETGSRVDCYPIGPFHLFPCAMPSLFKWFQSRSIIFSSAVFLMFFNCLLFSVSISLDLIFFNIGILRTFLIEWMKFSGGSWLIYMPIDLLCIFNLGFTLGNDSRNDPWKAHASYFVKNWKNKTSNLSSTVNLP